MLFDAIREIGDSVYQRMGDNVNVEINAYGNNIFLEVSTISFDVLAIVNEAVDEMLSYDEYDDALEIAEEMVKECETLFKDKKIEQYEISVGEVVTTFIIFIDNFDAIGFDILDYNGESDTIYFETVGENSIYMEQDE